MRDIYDKWEPQRLESNHFSITLIFNDLWYAFPASAIKCLDGLVVSMIHSYFGGREFETQPNRLL